MRKIFSFILILMLFGLPGVLCAADDAEMTVSQEEKDRICQMVKDKKYQLMEFVTLEESGIDVDNFRKDIDPYLFVDGFFCLSPEDIKNQGVNRKWCFKDFLSSGYFAPSLKFVSPKFFRANDLKIIGFTVFTYGGRCEYRFLAWYDTSSGDFGEIPYNKKILKDNYALNDDYSLNCSDFQTILEVDGMYYLLTDRQNSVIRVDKLVRNQAGQEINKFLCEVAK